MKEIAFDFSKNEILIDIDKKLNKKEREFLEIIRGRYKGANEKYIIFTEKELKKITNSKIDVNNFLDKFSKRRIHLKLIEKNEEIYFSSFYLFDFYIKNKNEYRLYISRSLKVLKESRIFDDINLMLILLFKEKRTFQLYLMMKKNISKENFILSIDQLKELLDVSQENYERFYDFEKTILKPVIEDINKLTKYNIDYQKIKNNEGITSKIISIKFNFSHKLSPVISEEIDRLLFPIKDRLDSISKVSKILEEALLKNGIDQVKNSLYSLNKDIKGNLDEAIYLILKEENIEEENNDKYVQLSETNEVFSNRFIFESRIYKELLKCKFYYNYIFLKMLRKMKVEEPLLYEDGKYKIEILYLDKGRNSTIKIYKKKDEIIQEKK